MTSIGTIKRIRAFCFGVIGIAYYYAAQAIAARAAMGLSNADWVDLVDRLLLLFLLLLGYGMMAYWLQKQGQPLYEMGLKHRAGWQREFGLGAALGWGAVMLTILPVVITGGLVVTVWGASRQWFLLTLGVLVLLAISLAEELVFRGYALQRFVEAFGQTGAVLMIAFVAALLQFGDPFAPRASIWVAFFLGWLLSLAFLRTRALWLPWGIRFAWYAATSLLFGLPIGGVSRYTPIVQSTTHGPDWLTGGDYGPAASVSAIFVMIVAIFVLLRTTKDYVYRYATPEIVAAGMPVDLDAIARRQHEAAMGQAPEPATPQLVQIGNQAPLTPPPPLSIEESHRNDGE